ncbi:bifunctional PIG-L family deacetylase/class I SAM-dependent methyltransferase [Curtobacterium aurantiacum]|uniref:PIG-L family deacetylase n=1 Tax=Curtobacterium aurantiacum TaxID=3236919 RepID=A0ABS5VIU4_9MICO|nr:bifunctional PIG-L family deacetylase/class I SAM-dependent methyltransferase [Curtobacterium flaccumfaciens]MBT1546850.1 PIG-L family deacetylase [Curtobacterium flaccumfaciens pv. flaccumfaciens]MBT1589411.1 PIG-L family deacetylase [Curtobacterium flaccumfaciens pv. flaccumfaciens]
MVNFDHREPGTDPAAWTTFLDRVDAPTIDLAGTGSVVVVAPHPDDETLGAGGLIAAAAQAGIAVHVLLLTRGERSHPDSPTTTPERLAATRDDEFVAALGALHPDATSTSSRIPDGATREHRAEVTAALDDVLAAAARPALLVAPWRGDGHRDHRIAGEVAEAAAASATDVTLLAYPIWAWHWDDPDASVAPWDRARTLPLPDALVARKRAALDAYPSQTQPLSPAVGDEAIVDDRHAAHHLRTTEWFFVPETTASRSRASFDAHYDRKPEGWDFDGSWYEQRKRAVTLAALPRPRFRSALELGCATGVLTAALADRADAVLGTDIAAAPLERAARRAPTARFVQAALPSEWPDGRWDLVVMSEVGYYLSPADLDATIDRVLGSLDDDGVLVACHWRHPDDEAVSGGDAVDARLTERWPRPALLRHVEEDFVLSVLPGPAVTSVARAEGIIR